MLYYLNITRKPKFCIFFTSQNLKISVKDDLELTLPDIL